MTDFFGIFGKLSGEHKIEKTEAKPVNIRSQLAHFQDLSPSDLSMEFSDKEELVEVVEPQVDEIIPVQHQVDEAILAHAQESFTDEERLLQIEQMEPVEQTQEQTQESSTREEYYTKNTKQEAKPCVNKKRRKIYGWRHDLARLKQMTEIRNQRPEPIDHTHDNFLTYMHSEGSFLPRVRSSNRKALFHWFCAGEDSYSSPLIHKSAPTEDHRTQVVNMLGSLKEALSYAEEQWAEAPAKSSQEELVNSGWMTAVPEPSSKKRIARV